jgi:hypothetical protein
MANRDRHKSESERRMDRIERVAAQNKRLVETLVKEGRKPPKGMRRDGTRLATKEAIARHDEVWAADKQWWARQRQKFDEMQGKLDRLREFVDQSIRRRAGQSRQMGELN